MRVNLCRAQTQSSVGTLRVLAFSERLSHLFIYSHHPRWPTCVDQTTWTRHLEQSPHLPDSPCPSLITHWTITATRTGMWYDKGEHRHGPTTLSGGLDWIGDRDRTSVLKLLHLLENADPLSCWMDRQTSGRTLRLLNVVLENPPIDSQE